MTGPRSFDRVCRVHQWPLAGSGACELCARDAERGVVVPRCPPVATWDRAFKAWLFDQYLLEASQTGTADDRRQQTWESMLHLVAGRHALREKWVTPAGTLYERLLGFFNRTVRSPARAGTEAGQCN